MGVKVGLSVGGGIGVGVSCGVLVGGSVEVASVTAGGTSAGVGVAGFGTKKSQARNAAIPNTRSTAMMIRKISSPDSRRRGFFLGVSTSCLFGGNTGGGGTEAFLDFWTGSGEGWDSVSRASI
jgi:hypothetical protein